MLNYSRAYFRDPDDTVLGFDELSRQPILRLPGLSGAAACYFNLRVIPSDELPIERSTLGD